MNACDKKTLQKNRTILVKELVCDEVLQILVEKNVVTDIMVGGINSKATSFERNVELLTLLPKRGPAAFSAFIEALDRSEQSHLSNKLRHSTHLSDVTSVSTHTLPKDIFRTFDKDASEYEVVTNVNSLSDSTNNPLHFSFNNTCKNQQNALTSTMHQSSTNFSPVSKLRVPTEHEDSRVVRHCNMCDCPVQPKRRHQDDNSSSVEYMDTVPSSYSSLEYLVSSATSQSLLSAALPSLPKQKLPTSNGSITANISSIAALNSLKRSSESSINIAGIDLADGPSLEDLLVRKGNYEFYESQFSACYKTNSKPRGLALIISIEKFESSTCLDNRLAGDVDRARLEFVLRQLGFKCYLLIDGTASEIWNVLLQFASLNYHDKCDVGFIAVMSHGEDKSFFGRDGGKVIINDVINLFNNVNCKGLKNKPKVLIFQCCRGGSPDKGVDETDGPTQENVDRINAPEGDRLSRSSSLNSIQEKVPTHSDCLVAYATVKGFAAMRNTKQGSWFIQALVRVFAYHSCDKDVTDMMTMVNNLVKNREGWSPASEYHRCKEMSIFHSTLCKKLYVFPV